MEEGGLKREWVGEVTYLILKEEYYFTLCVMAGGGTRPHLEFGLPVANDKVTIPRDLVVQVCVIPESCCNAGLDQLVVGNSTKKWT